MHLGAVIKADQRVLESGKIMRCQSCGREGKENVKFCQFCGAILAPPIDLSDQRLSAPRQMVARAIVTRSTRDKPLSMIWVAVIILTELASILVSIIYSIWGVDRTSNVVESVQFGVVPSAFGLVNSAVFAAFIYNLVKRQNDHYERDGELRTALSTLVYSAAWTEERLRDISPETRTISWSVARKERHREPVLWALVFLLPVVLAYLIAFNVGMAVPSDGTLSESDVAAVLGALLAMLLVALVTLVLEIYVMYFLTKTMIEHDADWWAFSYGVRRALSKLGFPSGQGYATRKLPERSMALYILLTVFTGIFIFYWIYVLVKDPNDHFKAQWEFEDSAIRAISPQGYAPGPRP